MADTPPPPSPRASRQTTLLDRIERLGNSLPEPALLFALLAACIVVLSAIGAAAGWKVQPVVPQVVLTPKVDAAGVPQVDAAGKAIMVPQLNADGTPEVKLVGQTDSSGSAIELRPRSLLTTEGIY